MVGMSDGRVTPRGAAHLVANPDEPTERPAEQAGAALPEPLFPPQYADPKSSGLKYTVTEDGGTYDIPLKK